MLKQIWQPIQHGSTNKDADEGVMYKKAGFESDRLHSQEIVLTPDGDIDSTEKIRGKSKIMIYSNAVEELKRKRGKSEVRLL